MNKKFTTPLTFFERVRRLLVALDGNFFERDLLSANDIQRLYYDELMGDGGKKDYHGFKLKYGKSRFTAVLDWMTFDVWFTEMKIVRFEKIITVLKKIGKDMSDYERTQELFSDDLRNKYKSSLDMRYDVMPELSEMDEGDFDYYAGASGTTVHRAEDLNGKQGTIGLDDVLAIVYDFENDGRKVFRIEEGLFDELLLTDVTKMDDYFLKLPYPSICLQLPYNDTISIGGMFVRNIYLCQDDIDGGYVVRSMVELSDGHVNYLELSFTGGDILEQVRRQVDDRFSSRLAQKDMKRLYTFLCAVILYMNSTDVPTALSYPFARSKVDSAMPVCRLGVDIRVNKEMRHLSAEQTDDILKNLIQVVKWTVRGHFRQQAHGEGRRLRRVTWIRPYVKGKERNNEEIKAKPGNYILK